MKTTTIDLDCKDPDVFGRMAHDLELSDEVRRRYLEFGEYAALRLVVNERMQIVSGEFLPVKP